MNTQSNRERVIDVAMHLFQQRGFGQTSLSDVAQDAGMLKGNLAYYFKTKSELLQAVLQTRQAALIQALSGNESDLVEPEEALGRLLAYVRNQASDLVQWGCPVGSLATELGKGGAAPEAAALLTSIEAFAAHHLARRLPEHQARLCAEHLLAVLQGAAVLAQAHRDAAVVHRQVDAAADWLQAVLGRPVQVPG
ncbi:TetR/AcrR family transcriptional regulator [Hydrogenophaga luteola]|uniref:TetR/AcrR family transcriptional regulator n=1 Tax=Hydrogenophaga luteola TaxID=1591122 RepID=A0ABV7VXK8_9BURK